MHRHSTALNTWSMAQKAYRRQKKMTATPQPTPKPANPKCKTAIRHPRRRVPERKTKNRRQAGCRMWRVSPVDLAASHKYLALAAAQGHEKAKASLSKWFPEGASAAQPPSSFVSSTSCAHCGVAATCLKACTRCRSVVYCGRDCQVGHWKAGHKKSCCLLVAKGN